MAPDESVRQSANQQDTISAAELFTIEQLEAHARALGQSHAAALVGRPTKPLLGRLARSAADRDRARRAMDAVDRELVLRAERLVLLLTPPFDRMRPDPGYIRGYLPGVRENGGQYTHAALWVALAFARLGDGERAFEILSLLNPVNQARTPEDLSRYKVEPYVVAADVYSVPPHSGRGGWTWYTGAAGWMYRVGLEAILGIRLHGSKLRVDPCVPPRWTEYDILLRRHGTEYAISVRNPDGVSHGVARIELDGRALATPEVPLDEDGGRHVVHVTLGRVTGQPPPDREAEAERGRQEAPLGGR